jgi:23S rRNA (guanosine2251-2'-O)-methyltransferase
VAKHFREIRVGRNLAVLKAEARKPEKSPDEQALTIMAEEILTGIHAVSAVLSLNPTRIRQIYIKEKQNNRRLEPIVEAAVELELPLKEVSRDKLDSLAKNQMHQGVVARCEMLPSRAEAELIWDVKALDHPAMLLVLDGVQDPHNLGACVRTLNSAGGDGIIIPKDRSAPVTSVVHKTASGAMETTPVYTVTNLSRTLQQLKDECGLWVIGTSDKADDTVYHADFTVPFALVLGAEGKGMRRLVSEQCDELLTIPMRGSVSSLNVSVAAGVCCFEALRQRTTLM